MTSTFRDVLVRLSTSAGDITICILGSKAPRSAQAFLNYLDATELNGVQFIRAVRLDNDSTSPKIEVLQTLPTQFDGDLLCGPFERTHESGLKHCDGAVSFAESDDGRVSPAAFFIAIGRQPELDSGGSRRADKQGFSVFGQVVGGMDIVRDIHSRKTIVSAPFPQMSGQMIASPVPIVSAHRIASSASTNLACLAEEFWDFRCREFPAESGQFNRGTGSSPFGGIAPTDFERRLNDARGMLKRVTGLDKDGLDDQEAITCELLVGQLSSIVDGSTFGEPLTPKLYPFGFTELPAYVLANLSLQTRQDCCNFIDGLRAIPAYFAGGLDSLKLAQSKGYRMPRVLAPRIRGMIEAQLAESGIESLVRGRFAVRPRLLDVSEFSQLQNEAERVVREHVRPALVSLIDYFSDEKPDLWRDSISICDQPNGKDYYRFKVRQQTTTDLTPLEIFDLGVEQVFLIQTELENLLRHADFDGSAREYASHLARSNIASSGEVLLEHARSISRMIESKLPLFFGRLPESAYEIRSFGLEQSLHRPPAMVQPAPSDFTEPSIFWLTAIPERCPTHLLLPLCLHEAWPGHLLQFSLAQENKVLPEFRRQTSLEYNAYIEGWALYCEKLGYDFGLYGNVDDRFGQLISDLWRAARLVVDTGIHWFDWPREKAIAYLSDHSFLPPETIASEVDRYIGMPAQALSYKVGEGVILSLRKESEKRLARNFSLRDFHDVLLSTGAVSLNLLERNVRRWMDTAPLEQAGAD